MDQHKSRRHADADEAALLEPDIDQQKKVVTAVKEKETVKKKVRKSSATEPHGSRTCEICGKTLKNAATMYLHARTHKEYECEGI